MATKTIVTRIKNKVDTLAAWQSYTGTLLDGEIVVVRVPTGTSYTNPVTGKSEPVVELLMKVGDGSTSFANLPWMSAKASDVYDWAKAATVEFNNTDYKIYFKQADGTTIASVDLSDIKAKITANTEAIAKLNGSNTTAGSVAKAIKDAIDAIDVTDAQATTDTTTTSKTNFVTKVTQTNGKIAVTKKALAEADLPSISSDKINVTANSTTVTLSSKLSTMDGAIAANTEKLAGHTDDAINTLITNKINALDVDEPSASGTSTSFIKTAKQDNGKIVVTKANLPTASASAAGITKLYTSVGTSTDGTVTRKVVNDINTQVETNKADIAQLKTAVTGGVHFIGVVTAKPTTSSVTVNGGSTATTAVAGDVVIWSAEGIEYIYTGSAWEELGDVDRIGAIETKISNMDYSGGSYGTSKFVTKVTETDGVIAATYEQPESADVLYASGGTDTVKTKIDENAAAIATKANSADVYTKTQTDSAISTAINNLDVSAPSVPTSGTTTATEFIDSVSQSNGKISATKKKLPTASTSVSGIVKLDNTVTSTSTSLAATANAVKTAYDKGTEALAAAAAAQEAAEHSHSTYVNQNAFSNIKVGDTTVAADTATDTVEFTGSNITITPDATNDKITFAVASASTSKAGIVKLSTSTSSTSTTTAATPSAVKAAYDLADDAKSDAAAIAANYVKIDDTNHLATQAGDTIVFDCGGAAD